MNERDRSTAHEADALTFLEVTQQAGTAIASAATAGDPDSLAEANALFHSAHAQAQLHATLSIAAAVRDLTNELEHHRLVP